MTNTQKSRSTIWRDANKEHAREYMREYQRRVKEERTGIPVVPRGPYNISPNRRTLSREQRELDEAGFDFD